MEIKYLGHSSFLIKTKTAKIVTDPFSPDMTGLKFPKVEADIVTVSHNHKDHNQVQLVQPSATTNQMPLVIDMAGEFEKMGVRIFGFRSFHDNKKGEERGENILFKIEAESISVLHCGDLGFVPEDSFLDMIGDIDILLIPVGGTYTINSDQAIELIKKIEPSRVIPMHYGTDKHKDKNLVALNEFISKYGATGITATPKLTVKKEDLVEEMKLEILEA